MSDFWTVTNNGKTWVRGPYQTLDTNVCEHALDAFAVEYDGEMPDQFTVDGTTYVQEKTGTCWHELFGTPERAARTLADIQCVPIMHNCENCSMYVPCSEYDRAECDMTLEETLLEWLEGKAE